eukprot:5060550-Pleurochrysis_carterae.AAC.1
MAALELLSHLQNARSDELWRAKHNSRLNEVVKHLLCRAECTVQARRSRVIAGAEARRHRQGRRDAQMKDESSASDAQACKIMHEEESCML